MVPTRRGFLGVCLGVLAMPLSLWGQNRRCWRLHILGGLPGPQIRMKELRKGDFFVVEEIPGRFMAFRDAQQYDGVWGCDAIRIDHWFRGQRAPTGELVSELYL
jgi:hypothetical protein